MISKSQIPAILNHLLVSPATREYILRKTPRVVEQIVELFGHELVKLRIVTNEYLADDVIYYYDAKGAMHKLQIHRMKNDTW